jgi:ComF family protein
MPLPALLDSLFPSRCLLCNGSVRSRKPLCHGCEHDLPWNGRACLRCAMPLITAEGTGAICGECLQHPPLFQRAYCAFAYAAPVDSLLNRYKHHGQLACGHWLAHALTDAITVHYQTHAEALPDCILPVPLHWRRLQTRGFDQALETGKVLSRRLQLPLINPLRRQRYTASQQGKSREERQRNLADAFSLRSRPAGRRVALIDDVLTTGSTANEITRLLQSAGVCDVHVWAVARTP